MHFFCPIVTSRFPHWNIHAFMAKSYLFLQMFMTCLRLVAIIHAWLWLSIFFTCILLKLWPLLNHFFITSSYIVNQGSSFILSLVNLMDDISLEAMVSYDLQNFPLCILLLDSWMRNGQRPWSSYTPSSCIFFRWIFAKPEHCFPPVCAHYGYGVTYFITKQDFRIIQSFGDFV